MLAIASVRLYPALVQNMAGLSCGHQSIRIVLEQEARGYSFSRGCLDCLHVTGMGTIAFFQRQSWIIALDPLLPGNGKRNIAAGVIAILRFVETSRSNVTAETLAQHACFQV